MVHFIYIEGLIGAGKTTLIKRLEENLTNKKYNVLSIYEPIDEWSKNGIFQLFYSEPTKYAYQFQTFVYVTRIAKIQESINNYIKSKCRVDEENNESGINNINILETLKNINLDYVLIERSIFSDKYFFVQNLYDNKMLTQIEFNMYNSWWDMWKCLISYISDPKFIYIKPSIAKTMNRISIRHRNGEVVEEIYQKNLEEYHNKFFNIGTDKNYLIATSTNDFINIYSTNVNIDDNLNNNAIIIETDNDFKNCDPTINIISENIISFFN